MHTSKLRAFAVSVAVLSLTHAAHADGGDVVFLKNGGRVRGTVVVEDPQSGVRIRLADGTIRNIVAAEVKSVAYDGQAPPQPAPPQPAVASAPVGPALPVVPVGSIHVEAVAPATVYVDGGNVGKAPADVKSAGPGRHRVRVEFDDGGSREDVVLVQAGETTKIRLELPDYYRVFRAHKGLQFGIAAEVGVPLFGLTGYRSFSEGNDIEAMSDNAAPLGGVGGGFLVEYGVSPAVDVRATAFFDVYGGTFTLVPIGASLGVHFNLGSVYTMSIGLRGGVAIIAGSNGSSPGPFVGPETSLVGFRFGSLRQCSIELNERFLYSSYTDDSLGFPRSTTVLTFENAITFTYHFLSEPEGGDAH